MTFGIDQAQKAVDRHLHEMNLTLEELFEHGSAGEFPTDKHRLIYALAQDLGLTSQQPV